MPHPVLWIDVDDVDRMAPFLVSVVSPSDHWLYASSRGGMTAGRVHAEGSLFPYWTDDRLHRAHEDSGGWTCMHVTTAETSATWEPLRPRSASHLRRRLAKSVAGDRLLYVEENLALGLTLRVQWAFSERYGLVRHCELHRSSGATGSARVRLADGLQGIIPAGPPLGLVQTSSCLVDAYARAEWHDPGQLAIFCLESIPSDRAEPAEALRANVAWCAGLDVETVMLSRAQLEAFVAGQSTHSESLIVGRRGAFVVTSTLTLEPGETARWSILADVDRTQSQVAELAARSTDTDALMREIDEEVDASTSLLDGILADVDGLQFSADTHHDAHQRASALFNAMRGGVPVAEHRVRGDAFADFVRRRNRPCYERNRAWLRELGAQEHDVRALFDRARKHGDADLARLVLERLPLWFGRRHGDPSRPWNAFSIQVREDDGSRRVAWQGNWRDVFQNWEALLLAYPHFIESVIAVFVNASTLDGYNPYRVTSEGVDWEQPEPENPWANLGYWGDHQVSYLTRLLEISMAHHPRRLTAWLDQDLFSSADVPYRLRDHDALVRDPRDAIVFDHGHQRIVDDREARVGSDGRRVFERGEVLHLNLAEKLLIPVLAKLSALIPGAGIWMNTQRPEWNDANNALAGNGVSVVTAAYLRRHLRVLGTLFQDLAETVTLTQATASWLDDVATTLAAEPSPWTPSSRREVVDALGRSAEAYRAKVYAETGRTRTTQPRETLLALCTRGIAWLDDALRQALRPDGLYDGYDLVRFGAGTAQVERLYPMLEGQVAVLASGVLSASEAADLVDRMFESGLYRADVQTFMLYPYRSLPGFLAKNQVPETTRGSAAVHDVLARGLTDILVRDPDGTLRFGPDLRNAGALREALVQHEVDPDHHDALLDLYEATFHHHAFTGRSGTMHAYEGLGSVYWHMVGKLLVAVQEAWLEAKDAAADPSVVARLAAAYSRVRHGLGFNRTPAEFGAIPTDPYSHTPWGRGAQQPGMTGLVKEELLARRAELGIRVASGRLTFGPGMIRSDERLEAPATWTLPEGVRPQRTVHLPTGAVGTLVCGVPVVLCAGAAPSITVVTDEGEHHIEGSTLDRGWSSRVFARDPAIHEIRVQTR